MIKPEKFSELQKKMESLGIFEEDLVEKFVLSSGSGGQHVQKSSTCVFLHHLPSNLRVKCQQGRSRELNRLYARRLLVEKYEAMILKIKTAKQQEIEKIRRQKRKRSKRSKEKMLEGKRMRSEVKEGRAEPEQDV